MSDLWWNPNESGWGVNIIEQQGILFITLFVYGADGKPTWLVGPDTRRVSASTSSITYSGSLYTTSGPWFGGSFNPANVGIRQVGSITFVATSPVKGQLSYSVDGIVVSKAVERQTWNHINLGGTYYGASDALSSSTCSLSASSQQPFFTSHSITAYVSTTNARTGTLAMTFYDGSTTMTFNGSYVQFGALYEVSGSMSFQGATYSATIRDFTADDDGIRGNLYLLSATGCYINLRFSAVRPG
jgi:hypothetical protein